MSFKVHVIHDLMYGFNEATDSADLELPDCDIVILNGHISRSAKRTMLYATELTTTGSPQHRRGGGSKTRRRAPARVLEKN